MANTHSDWAKVRKLGGTQYAQLYNLIKSVKIIKAGIEYKKDKYIGYGEWSKIRVFAVEHETGSFSFPIENVHGDHRDAMLRCMFLDLIESLQPAIKQAA